MKWKKIDNRAGAPASVSPALMLFFAGWGMDEHPFESLSFEGFDVIVVWDYDDATPLDGSLFASYSEICVVAWSFGVVNADNFMTLHPDLPFTMAVAVNGTLFPVDDERGIPERVFDATLENLSERSVSKFNYRMCGSREMFNRFSSVAPKRSLQSVRDELPAMRRISSISPQTAAERWTSVVVAASDAIFPSESQLRAWEGHPAVRVVEGAHYLDFEALLRPMLICKDEVGRSFNGVADSYGSHAVVQHSMARRLAGMIGREAVGFRHILEFGCGTGFLTSCLKEAYPEARFELWDLKAQFDGVTECDAEVAIRRTEDESFDLIAGASVLQWFHSPELFLLECYRALRPGGIIAVATFGPENFSEVTSLGVPPLAYRSVGQWREFFARNGWNNALCVDEFAPLHFQSPADVLRHMRLTGVNRTSPGDGRIAAARRLLASYPVDAVTGECRLTYHSLFFIIRKPS